jgi:hypothetical protein
MGLWRDDRPSRTANFERKPAPHSSPFLVTPSSWKWFLLDFVGSAISLRREIAVYLYIYLYIYDECTRVSKREGRDFSTLRIASLFVNSFIWLSACTGSHVSKQSGLIARVSKVADSLSVMVNRWTEGRDFRRKTFKRSPPLLSGVLCTQLRSYALISKEIAYLTSAANTHVRVRTVQGEFSTPAFLFLLPCVVNAPAVSTIRARCSFRSKQAISAFSGRNGNRRGGTPGQGITR